LALNAEIIESLSYLALAHHNAGAIEKALELSGEAMKRLEAQKDVEEVQAIYLNHYRILNTTKDPSAVTALEKAHEIMTAQADSIVDPDERDAFLNNVRVNRMIVETMDEIS
jgi:hypothetical protein